MTSDKPSSTVTIYIDEQPYQVASDNNLLAGVLSQKLNLPYFCWHPSMGSVGACRQCAVTQYQDEHDKRGRLVMACTTPVAEGMRISLKDTASTQFREQVIAAMMTNHPHDCPVCAEGGECHLQDMTVMTGHTSRSYQGEKRTFTNQYLGEFIGHEMNRCITCYRCLRFYKDYAGGQDFGVYGSKNQVYFGRQQDGPLESEFSGNLVEVCPTGVFTNKLFSAHYTRKWDLQSAPSVCGHCSVGCNTSVGERYGSVRRVMNRYNHDINGYFLCDRGRFAIGFVNGEQRIRKVKGIKQSSPERLTKLDVSKALVHFRGKKFIGVGSARASFEANYLLKQYVGGDSFSLGLTNEQMQLAALHQDYLTRHQPITIAEIEHSDFVLIIDEDITQTAPRMALAVRQALRNLSIEKADLLGVPSWQDSAVRTIGGQQLSPLYLIQAKATKLDDVAEQLIMQSRDASVSLLNVMHQLLTANTELSAAEQQTSSLLNQLLQAKKPLIIGGWGSQCPQLFKATIDFIEAVTAKNSNTRSIMVAPQANTVGTLALLDQETLSFEQVVSAVERQSTVNIDGIIFLEQELSGLTETQINQLKHDDITLIALEHSDNAITKLADMVLPVAAITEGDGHVINYQGQIQAYHQVHPSQLPIMASWRWLTLMATILFSEHPLAQDADSLTDLHARCRQFDNDWPITPLGEHQHIARETKRASGRTAKYANISVHEPKTSQSTGRYRFSMEGERANTTGEMPFTWAPGWNSNQAINQFQPLVTGPVPVAEKMQLMTFEFKTGLLTQWSEELLEQVPALAAGQLHFSPIVKWNQGDWQARLTPEFRIIEQQNYLVVSPKFAEQYGWQTGQWLQLNCQLTGQNDAITVIARLGLDERLNSQMCYGELNEVVSLPIAKVTVMEASEQQVGDYLACYETQISQAKIEQEQGLKRLKQQDQYIPIRLVNGGLDDV